MTTCPKCGKDTGIKLDSEDWDRIGESHACPHCGAKLSVGQDIFVSILDGTEENYVCLELEGGPDDSR
jgi:DNA-directed RNA polymerase subunit RPC12/RpoP